MARRPAPRPLLAAPDAAPPTHTIEFQDRPAQQGWEVLVGRRKTDMTECWDHLANSPHLDLPRKCKALVGRFARSGLRQYTVGPKERVWYTVEGKIVTIRDVHRTPPKETD